MEPKNVEKPMYFGPIQTGVEKVEVYSLKPSPNARAGSFLVGFGLCILLFCLGANLVLAQYYVQVMGWRNEVEQIYQITHSPAYEASMNALETLSRTNVATPMS